MENLGIPSNHISQLMGHEDGNMALDVYSGGLAIEPLRESITKLTYGSEIDSLVKISTEKFHNSYDNVRSFLYPNTV